MSDPVTPLRLSDINLDRLNKLLVQLNQQLQGLSDRIAVIEKVVTAATSGKPGYPGIENGSAAIIQGPVPGGPSPIPPYLTPHTLIVGEGSKPVRLIEGSDGQIPIACGGGTDPVFANIIGDSTAIPPATPRGIVVINGCNAITLTLGKDIIDFLIQVAGILGIAFG